MTTNDIEFEIKRNILHACLCTNNVEVGDNNVETSFCSENTLEMQNH